MLAEQTTTPYTQHQWTAAPSEHFSGSARFTRLPEIPNSPDGSAIVEFQAGTITDWHSHSQGQYLIVTEGEGRTQEWGKPIQIIKKGDVIAFQTGMNSVLRKKRGIAVAVLFYRFWRRLYFVDFADFRAKRTACGFC